MKKGIEAKETTLNSASLEKINLAIYELKLEQQIKNVNDTQTKDLEKKLNEQDSTNFFVVKWDKYIIFDLKENIEYRIGENDQVEYWGKNNIGNILKNTISADTKQIEQDATKSNIIGIDNNGNTVNMCHWNYTLLDNGTYTLISKDSLDALNEKRWEDIGVGYIGNFDENGKIEDEIPAYISVDNGKEYVSVTSISYTFPNMTQLRRISELPNTLIDMSFSFTGSSIEKIEVIPKGVKNLDSAFFGCSNFWKIDSIPETVENMRQTFRKSNLKNLPELPDSLLRMDMICMECSNLKNVENIPKKITNITNAFNGCSNLDGDILVESENIKEGAKDAFWHTKLNLTLKVVKGSETENYLGDFYKKNLYENIKIAYL